MFTSSDADPPETVTPVDVVRDPNGVDLAGALALLRSERGVRSLLCEGGPHLHAQLLQADLIDELFVTHAPKLAGGEGTGLVAGLPEAERPLELAWLVSEPETGELFARYRVAGWTDTGIAPCASTSRSPRRRIRRASIVPPMSAAAPSESWTLRTPSGVQ